MSRSSVEDVERPHVTRERWPQWVYKSGSEPDYRFTFANERTFLAWIRTALALLAAGVALDSIDLSMPATAQAILVALLVLSGLACAFTSWFRWARAERAMRRQDPLPASGLTTVLAVTVVTVAVVVLVVCL
jgi:putative membrane protein